MNKLIVLEIKSAFGGRITTINPVIWCEENEMILVDTGYPGQTDIFRDEAANKGIDLSRLTKIVITHHDVDHIGSLPEMKRINKLVKVLSSETEADYISGKKDALRLVNSRKMYESLPEEQKAGALAYQKVLESIEKTSVDILLKDNELIPGCEGVRVITTPGHMPGHLSVYIDEIKTFISGDALGVENDKLFINAMYTLDMKQARESLKKLLLLNIETIICYHGGVFKGDCRKALMELVKE